MSKASPTLQTLLALAEKKTDQASTELSQANRQVAEANAQMDMLNEYRREYINQNQANMTSGLHATEIQNFRSFLNNLDKTIVGQEQIVRHFNLLADKAKRAWQEAQKKKMSYEVLIEKERNNEMKKQDKRDQKMTDEFANSRTAMKLRRG